MKWAKAKKILQELIKRELRRYAFDANVAEMQPQYEPTPSQKNAIKIRKELHEILDLLDKVIAP